MAARTLKVLLNHSSTRLLRASKRAFGAGGAYPPPFARTLPPNRQLEFDHDLIWDDGVAAETMLDFDAPHISTFQALCWWLGGFGFFGSIATIISLYNPVALNPVHPRTILTDNFGGNGEGLTISSSEEDEDD